jgi:flagellar protein FliS
VVGDASPHRLVKMLFDGAIDAVAQARGALARGDHATKGERCARAVRILEEGLRGGLDRRAGGELAANLDGLYGYIVQRLTHANLHHDDAALTECVELLTPLRDAWQTIDPLAARA